MVFFKRLKVLAILFLISVSWTACAQRFSGLGPSVPEKSGVARDAGGKTFSAKNRLSDETRALLYDTSTPGLELPVITKRVAVFKHGEWDEMTEVGYLLVEAIFRADAVIAEVRVLRSTLKDHELVHERVVAALEQWEFRPGRLDGHNVDVRMAFRVSFCGS